MKNNLQQAKKQISVDRNRTNLLRNFEQPTIAYLCSIMPSWVTPNMMTGVGMVANFVVFAGFYLAKSNPFYLGLAILGFTLNWFGDSLDGRLAYYRNIPRKWYGFALDICMDWLTTFFIGFGFYYFLPDHQKVIAMLFIANYAWSMILTLLRYKIADLHQIDSGIFSPTELRIGLSLVLFVAMFYPSIIAIFGTAIMIVVFVINLVWFKQVLEYGNERDAKERATKNN